MSIHYLLPTASRMGKVLEGLRKGSKVDTRDLIRDAGLSEGELMAAESLVSNGPIFKHFLQLTIDGLGYIVQVRAKFLKPKPLKPLLAVTLIPWLDCFEENFLELLRTLFKGELRAHLEHHKTSLQEISNSVLKLDQCPGLRFGEFVKYFENLGIVLEFILARIDKDCPPLQKPFRMSPQNDHTLTSDHQLQALFLATCSQLGFGDDAAMLCLFDVAGMTEIKLRRLREGSLKPRSVRVFISNLEKITGERIRLKFDVEQLGTKSKNPNSQAGKSQPKRKRGRGNK